RRAGIEKIRKAVEEAEALKKVKQRQRERVQPKMGWDAPNGWAPLQWMAIQGLNNYGYTKLSTEISRRWINNNRRVYQNTGKLVEKYNVQDISLEAGGGEYPVQDGFGWSNGVLLKLIEVTKDQ
ncbi:MAG: trehalase family glycosidase, partial [Bacteroidota bacterium]